MFAAPTWELFPQTYITLARHSHLLITNKPLGCLPSLGLSAPVTDASPEQSLGTHLPWSAQPHLPWASPPEVSTAMERPMPIFLGSLWGASWCAMVLDLPVNGEGKERQDAEKD